MSLNVKSEHAESTEMSAIQNQIMRQNYNLPKAYNDILGNRMSFNLDLFIVLSSWDDMSSKASQLLSS